MQMMLRLCDKFADDFDKSLIVENQSLYVLENVLVKSVFELSLHTVR